MPRTSGFRSTATAIIVVASVGRRALSRAHADPGRALPIILDACRLDEKQLTSVLTHAGNQFDWQKITEALQFLSPPGTTVLGKPLDGRRSSQSSTQRQSTQRQAFRPQSLVIFVFESGLLLITKETSKTRSPQINHPIAKILCLCIL